MPREMAVRVKGISPDRTRLTDRWLGTSNPLRECMQGVVASPPFRRTSHTALLVLVLLYRLHGASHSLTVSVSSIPPRFLRIALLAAGLFGCASTAVSPPRNPDPTLPREPDRTPVPPTAVGLPLSFTYRDGTYAYDLHQLTIVTVGSQGAPPVEDTLRTRGALTYSVSSSTGVPAVSVTVDSLTIASVRDTAAQVRQLMTPVVLQLPLVQPPAPITAEDSLAFLSTCDSMEETARNLATDIHIQIRVPIQAGQQWADSTSSTLCRGAIPLTAVRMSRYQITAVRDTRDSAVVTVARQTSLTISGSGMQGARRITVRGEGTSDALFTYDVRAGRFLQSTGQSVLQLGFETIQQTEQIIQRSTSTVRLRSIGPAEPDHRN